MANRPTLRSFLEPAPTGFRAFRKKIAAATGMHGAFSGKTWPPPPNHEEAAVVIAEDSDDEAVRLINVYLREHPTEAKTITVKPHDQPLAYHAVVHNQWKTTQTLLEAGASIGPKWDGAVVHAMNLGGDDIALPLLLRYLAEEGAPEDGKGADEDGNTLIHKAAEAGCLECSKELLAAQWDPQRQNNAGETADQISSRLHGAEHGVTRVLQEARRAAELGLSLGRVGQRRKWASEYKASIKHEETDAMQKQLAEKKGVVQERQVWAENYKANVDKKDTEEMRKQLASKKGVVAERKEWAQNYKAEVKRQEMEEMKRHLGDKSIVAERQQWATSYQSPKNRPAASGTMDASDAKATIGRSTANLREKWKQQAEGKEASSTTIRGKDNAMSTEDAKKVIGSNTSALRARWQNQTGSASAEAPASPASASRPPQEEPDEGLSPMLEEVGAAVDQIANEHRDEEFTIEGKPLGFQIGEHGNLVTVLDLRADGNAHKAGIEKDDVLLEINGESLLQLSSSDALKKAQGLLTMDESFPARIKIRRFVLEEEPQAKEGPDA